MVTIRPIRAEDREGFYHLVKENNTRLVDYFPITIEKASSPEIAAEAIEMYNLLASKNELHVLVIEKDTDKKIIKPANVN